MKRWFYLNFTDLSEETQEEIMDIARQNVLEEDKEEIIEMYGEDRLEEIVRERAERELYNMDFVFNV